MQIYSDRMRRLFDTIDQWQPLALLDQDLLDARRPGAAQVDSRRRQHPAARHHPLHQVGAGDRGDGHRGAAFLVELARRLQEPEKL